MKSEEKPFRLRYEKLFLRMHSRGVTLADLTAALNIAERTVYRKINGETQFTWSEIKTICTLLDIGNPLNVFP